MFPYEVYEHFSISVKNAIGIQYKDYSDPSITLSSVGILTILILPVHEYGTSRKD